MDKNEKLKKIKDLTTQIINFKSQSTADKVFHFVFGRGNLEIYRGDFNGKKAYFAIQDQSIICWVSFAVEINTDFLSFWKKIFAVGAMQSKYKNIIISPDGFLRYLAEIKQIPAEMIEVEGLRRFFDKLFQLARNIENNEKSNALATLRQSVKMQYEEIDWWGTS